LKKLIHATAWPANEMMYIQNRLKGGTSRNSQAGGQPQALLLLLALLLLAL
jgi:hypothetical protein